MDEDDAGGMPGQGLLHYAAGVDHRPVHRPFLHNLMLQNPVLGIQKNDHEGFMGQACQLHPGEVQNRLGGRENLPSLDLFRQVSRAHFFDQPDQGGGDRSDLGHLFQIPLARIQDTGKASEAFD